MTTLVSVFLDSWGRQDADYSEFLQPNKCQQRGLVASCEWCEYPCHLLQQYMSASFRDSKLAGLRSGEFSIRGNPAIGTRNAIPTARRTERKRRVCCLVSSVSPYILSGYMLCGRYPTENCRASETSDNVDLINNISL